MMSKAKATAKKPHLVAVGNGMASAKLIEELVARDRDRYAITVIGEEPQDAYNRIKLVVKLKDPDLPDLFLNTSQWYADNGIRLMLGRRVETIDRGGRSVVLDNGERLQYDTLVLATGSRPFVPPMPGLDLPGIFTLRQLDDVDRIRDYLEDESTVMVVGGGLLGIELALMLRLLGKRVTVSHLMPTLMEMQLPEEAGRYLQRHLEGLGITFVMGTYITELLGSTAGVSEARFKDGRTLATGAVFFNCGIRPNADLARQCSLVCNRGVAVDERLQTSDPNIYACGECLEFQGTVWGLVAPIYEQARTLAAILCGEAVEYTPSAPAPTRLKSDIPVISMGRFTPMEGDEVTRFSDPASGIYKKLLVRDSRLVGAVLVGEDLNIDLIGLHYTAKIPVPKQRSELLFPGARGGEAIVDGKLIPDDAQVCDCNGVPAGRIRTAIQHGDDTLLKVMASTRAGTGCGTCKNKIRALLISEVGELREDPAERWFVPGIPLERPELSQFIRDHDLRSVSQVLAAIPDSTDDAKTRLGLNFLLGYLWNDAQIVENDARSANDRHAGNIQNDGRYSVIPDIAAGLATSQQLRAIADVADAYGATIKVTGADRIGLYAIEKKDLKDVWQRLQMGSGHAYSRSFRACKACVGSTFCRFGIQDSLALGKRLGSRYRGLSGPAKLKMGVSGCPRNCSESTIKDFGVVAVEGGWQVVIGGNGGAHVVVAHTIATVKTDDEVVALADRFYEHYRRHAKYAERSAPFIERVGLKSVTDAILNGTPEAMQELESAMQTALDAYRDPWKDEANAWDAAHPAATRTDAAGYLSLADTDEIPAGDAKLFDVDGVPVVVFHGRDGSWVATHGLCPHKQGPLIDSMYGDGRIMCPLHSNTFDVESGVCDDPTIDPLTVYRVQIRGDRVWVRVTPAAVKS